jgi:hypothetical protein
MAINGPYHARRHGVKVWDGRRTPYQARRQGTRWPPLASAPAGDVAAFGRVGGKKWGPNILIDFLVFNTLTSGTLSTSAK